jgi:hypothetical protein
MKLKIEDIIKAAIKTVLLLFILEITSSAILPALGASSFRMAFNILIVLYLALKLDTPLLPVLILITQLVHSVFSVEGWAIGTIIGVLISIVVSYLRENIQFTNWVSTVILVQIFQLLWFSLSSLLLSVKIGSFTNYFTMLWNYIPESILLSLLAPFFFGILNYFWKVDDRSRIGV